jgi:hypothetical protein
MRDRKDPAPRNPITLRKGSTSHSPSKQILRRRNCKSPPGKISAGSAPGRQGADRSREGLRGGIYRDERAPAQGVALPGCCRFGSGPFDL